MATSIPATVNDKIKKKLLALSENVRRNLLLAAGDVERKFILEERDLLSILVLAIQYLQHPPQPTQNPPPTPSEQQQEKQQQQEQQQEQQRHQEQQQSPSSPTTPETDTMGKSGGGKIESKVSNDLETSEKLRKELLKILESTSFDSDAKSWILLETYNRYKNNATLAKEREILDNHLKRHPNVFVGGGGDNNHSDESNSDKMGEDDVNNKKTNNDTMKEKQTNNETTNNASTSIQNTPSKSPQQLLTSNSNPTNNPVGIWIDDAIKVITSYMKNKVNVIFLENVQNHASRLQNFLSSKATFDKNNNRVIAPNARFYLKKDSLYFKIKTTKELQSFDLATLLACVSFSKSKLFRFLKYRFKKVKAFSKNEKNCLRVFLTTCPISKRRIPCSSIRDLAKA